MQIENDNLKGFSFYIHNAENGVYEVIKPTTVSIGNLDEIGIVEYKKIDTTDIMQSTLPLYIAAVYSKLNELVIGLGLYEYIIKYRLINEETTPKIELIVEDNEDGYESDLYILHPFSGIQELKKKILQDHIEWQNDSYEEECEESGIYLETPFERIEKLLSEITDRVREQLNN